jgi:hypothetical protein
VYLNYTPRFIATGVCELLVGYFAGLRVTKRNKATVLTNTNPIPNTNSNPNPDPNPTPKYSKFVSKPILKKKVLTKSHSEVSEITSTVSTINMIRIIPEIKYFTY